MTKRSTEDVLRAEVAGAEKALERAKKNAETHRLHVVDAMDRQKEANAEKETAAENLRRAQAALTAFLPEPEDAGDGSGT